MADHSPAWELGQDPGFEHSEREDSLEDSASHIATTPYLREVPPPTTAVPATTPAPYADPVFIAQIVRAVIETMPQLPVPTPLVAPATQIPQVAHTPVDNVVTLVRVVKSMRELGCDSFSGEPDVEIAGRWLRTIEDIMEQIRVTEELRVHCATHLLSDRARSWWDTMRSRRPAGSWTWIEFRVQFEN
jgi:hypothetical protein